MFFSVGSVSDYHTLFKNLSVWSYNSCVLLLFKVILFNYIMIYTNRNTMGILKNVLYRCVYSIVCAVTSGWI